MKHLTSMIILFLFLAVSLNVFCCVHTFSTLNSQLKLQSRSRSQSLNKPSIRYPKFNIKLTKRKMIDHLFDCNVYKSAAEFLNDDGYCLKPANGIFTDIYGLFGQIGSFSSLVILYYFLDRSKLGFKEWRDDEIDESIENNSHPTEEKCPLCSGMGSYMTKNQDVDVCTLCHGRGYIKVPETFKLPKTKY